jgi:hypothetical protein
MAPRINIDQPLFIEHYPSVEGMRVYEPDYLRNRCYINLFFAIFFLFYVIVVIIHTMQRIQHCKNNMYIPVWCHSYFLD